MTSSAIRLVARSWSKCAFERMLESMWTPLTPTSVRRRRHLELEAVVPSRSVTQNNGKTSTTLRPELDSVVPSKSPSMSRPGCLLYNGKPGSPPAARHPEYDAVISSKNSSSVRKQTSVSCGRSRILSTTRTVTVSSSCTARVVVSSSSSPTSPKLGQRAKSSSTSFRTNGKGLGRTSSAGSSPASHRSAVSRASTEEELSIRLDKNSYQHMFHDIVSIKSMLLKLNRVLTESEGGVAPCTEEDASMDLKKQVAFLQQQLKQREATLQSLQNEVNLGVDRRSQVDPRPSCNAATQTDRVRPASTGPSLLQNLPSDSSNIVSNGSSRKASESLDDNTRLTVIRTAPAEKNVEDNNRQAVLLSAPAEKILEKVKKLSFKPVEVLERERAERRAISGKNVFKITKIDLVLKSDNYGQSDFRLS